MAKKNLKVFRELCGDDRLEHVRIVTTFWNVASAKEGEDHEAALAAGVFKPFLEAGAKLVRHDNGLESAKNIISDLTRQAPVTMKIQEELDAGMVLGDTSAGAVIVEEMKELQKKHAQEMEELTKELEEATNENDEDLRAELDAERKKLAEKIARVEEDRERLTTMQAGLETLSHQSANIIDRGSAEHDGLVGEERRERPQTPDSRRIPHHEPHNTLEEGSAPRSVQERMERIIAMRAKDVADLKEVLERIGESNDALRREREELEQRIARSDTETEELKKVLSQLSQDRNSRETRDEVVKAAVARALEEERRKSYADCAMKLAEHIPLVPTIISKPVLGVMGFGLDVMRSHFQQ
ncbi:hypothetical protein APHAL10511_001409 [Amanita phalloides]|nr:hypothetical protein APHAL10511_001409 [Amanita phalloides]